jgi:hypothetical protein
MMQAIGAAPDAVRMQRVVNFYEKLPRGPAPEIKPKGLLGKYQAKHFGKNPSAKRMSIKIPISCYRSDNTDQMQPSSTLLLDWSR